MLNVVNADDVFSENDIRYRFEDKNSVDVLVLRTVIAKEKENL